MQDRAKRTMFYHNFGKYDKLNHVLDKGSMVANPFFRNSYLFLLHRFRLHRFRFSNSSNFNTLPQ